jgi:hypothetical protein
MDLRKAFPSVSRHLLLQKLNNLGISSKMMNIITALYQPDTFSIVSGNDLIGNADHGTKEGSCLSPLLFSLFISDLPEFLTGQNIRSPKIGKFSVRVLQFADDTALIATGRRNLQKLLNLFCIYCKNNQLSINSDKTEIINLRKGARGSIKDIWNIEYNQIGIAKKATYLGAVFSTGRKGNHHLQKILPNIRTKARLLVGRLKRADLTQAAFCVSSFHSLITPIVSYAFPFLLPVSSPHTLGKLNPVLNQFLRAVWRLPRSTSNFQLLQFADTFCLECVCHLEAVCFLIRKLKNWSDNSELIETLIKELFADRLSNNWLTCVLSAVRIFWCIYKENVDIFEGIRIS